MIRICPILPLLLLSGLLDSAVAQEEAGDALVVLEEQRTDEFLTRWLIDETS